MTDNGITREAYQFTNNWFENDARPVWDHLIPQLNPMRILEIGSYEGASTCYLVDTLSPRNNLEIHCIDTWEGGLEHKPGGHFCSDMSAVESRFSSNTRIACEAATHSVDIHIHKGPSELELARLLSSRMKNYFDLVYVDGSHQASDVLYDAVLGFRLLRNGGIIIFDDYLWHEDLPYGQDPLRCPKIAIDSFTNIYCRKIRTIPAPLCQIYIQKICD